MSLIRSCSVKMKTILIDKDFWNIRELGYGEPNDWDDLQVNEKMIKEEVL